APRRGWPVSYVFWNPLLRYRQIASGDTRGISVSSRLSRDDAASLEGHCAGAVDVAFCESKSACVDGEHCQYGGGGFAVFAEHFAAGDGAAAQVEGDGAFQRPGGI